MTGLSVTRPGQAKLCSTAREAHDDLGSSPAVDGYRAGVPAPALVALRRTWAADPAPQHLVRPQRPGCPSRPHGRSGRSDWQIAVDVPDRWVSEALPPAAGHAALAAVLAEVAPDAVLAGLQESALQENSVTVVSAASQELAAPAASGSAAVSALGCALPAAACCGAAPWQSPACCSTLCQPSYC